ncbi:MAG TPA: hypothetical protein VFD43_00250 [Planctomycetota bacterium]|nr:hypothetical protein [Planctomycetota bacterium]
MSASDKLVALLARCKCGVYLSVNEHRDFYQSVEKWIEERYRGDPEGAAELAPEVRAKMIETNAVVVLQFYPDTPISSYDVLHYDIGAALAEALAILAELDAKQVG